jgi:molecular chaperone HtpG
MGSAPFQVDLRGVVDLLGRTFYSTSRVFLRELLQNGVDAVRARAKVDPAAESGLLEIWPAAAGAADQVFPEKVLLEH